MLLAGLSRIKKKDRIIELGTGCGVVSLVLAYRRKTDNRIIGVEIQPELAGLALQNVNANGLGDRVEIRQMDLRESTTAFRSGSFDLVVGNPPYRKPGAGRINPDRQKAIARHELAADLSDVFRAAKHLLPQGGRIALIYPATRLAHLMNSARDQDFSPKRLTIIYSNPGGPGKIVHLECLKGGGEQLTIEPPFYVYDENGFYTKTMDELYAE